MKCASKKHCTLCWHEPHRDVYCSESLTALAYYSFENLYKRNPTPFPSVFHRRLLDRSISLQEDRTPLVKRSPNPACNNPITPHERNPTYNRLNLSPLLNFKGARFIDGQHNGTSTGRCLVLSSNILSFKNAWQLSVFVYKTSAF